MNIWINGAEGFIGSYLVAALKKKENKVLCTSKDGSSTLFGVQCDECDITNSRAVDDLIRDFRPDQIYHLAAQSLPNLSFEEPKRTFDVNVNGSLNVFDAVLKYSTESEIVIASTSAQYGDVEVSRIPVTEDHDFWPLQPYGVSKACMEMLAHQMYKSHGLKYKSARIFNTTGPRKKNDICGDFWERIRNLLNKKSNANLLKIPTGRLDTKRAYLDVRDTVEGLIFISHHGRVAQAYNICGDHLHSGADILGYFSEVIGVPVVSEQNNSLFRPTDEKIIYGNSQKLKNLGWSQKFHLKQTIEEIVNDEKY